MGRKHQKKRRKSYSKILLTSLLVLTLFLAIAYEIRTSVWQAAVFSWYAKKVTWKLQAGASQDISFPLDGPFDISRGYTKLPNFQRWLKGNGYVVTSQAGQSEKALFLSRNGVPIPYDRRDDIGLRLNDKNCAEL